MEQRIFYYLKKPTINYCNYPMNPERTLFPPKSVLTFKMLNTWQILGIKNITSYNLEFVLHTYGNMYTLIIKGSSRLPGLQRIWSLSQEHLQKMHHGWNARPSQRIMHTDTFPSRSSLAQPSTLVFGRLDETWRTQRKHTWTHIEHAQKIHTRAQDRTGDPGAVKQHCYLLHKCSTTSLMGSVDN